MKVLYFLRTNVQVWEDDGTQGYLSAYQKFLHDNPDLVKAQLAV